MCLVQQNIRCVAIVAIKRGDQRVSFVPSVSEARAVHQQSAGADWIMLRGLISIFQEKNSDDAEGMRWVRNGFKCCNICGPATHISWARSLRAILSRRFSFPSMGCQSWSALCAQVSPCKLLLVPVFRQRMGETFSFLHLHSQMFMKEHTVCLRPAANG